jgi:hypothetical protein
LSIAARIGTVLGFAVLVGLRIPAILYLRRKWEADLKIYRDGFSFDKDAARHSFERLILLMQELHYRHDDDCVENLILSEKRYLRWLLGEGKVTNSHGIKTTGIMSMARKPFI